MDDSDKRIIDYLEFKGPATSLDISEELKLNIIKINNNLKSLLDSGHVKEYLDDGERVFYVNEEKTLAFN